MLSRMTDIPINKIHTAADFLTAEALPAVRDVMLELTAKKRLVAAAAWGELTLVGLWPSLVVLLLLATGSGSCSPAYARHGAS